MFMQNWVTELANPTGDKAMLRATAQVVVEFGFLSLMLHRIYAAGLGRNLASATVLEKLSMVYEGNQK